MRLRLFAFLLAAALPVACARPAPEIGGPQGDAAPEISGESPVLSPAEALESFVLPPGYRIELVASEPLVNDPVAIDIDAEGRLWVAEMRGYMPTLEGKGEDAPIGRIVVLEDANDDGRMDRSTVYMDSLVLPRAIRVLRQGVLVAAPPFLWLTRDTNGDLRADAREVVRSDYGDPTANPELNANGLLWGLDNWIHSALYDVRLRLRDGRWEHAPTLRRGQWGISMDDFGRTYRTSNERPLQVDLVPPHYLSRNPSLTRTRGVYEDIVENDSVWPAHPTPGVNRGYRETVLRGDSTLSKFTAAGGTTVYRGDRLPRELSNNVFVTEPAGNLVRRFVVTEHADGALDARNAYERSEFLASTDERFRPVNLYSAPDGTLYVVDMYRGVIQHREYLTDYLRDHIRRRELQRPLGHGRIYRIVHASTRRDRRPRLSGTRPAELVRHLSHPNGWWRDVAQRLLVERADPSVAPALRALALSAADQRTRLHALWTLEGLGELDVELLRRSLADRSPHLRAAAIRLAEPWLRQPGHPLRTAVLALSEDASPLVRRQLAASLGEIPGSEHDDARIALLDRFGDDPVLVDLVASGLRGRELPFLERLLAGSGSEAPRRESVRILAATATKAGGAAQAHRLFGWIGEESRPAWQRLSLLEGAASALRGGGDPGAQELPQIRLAARPEGVLAAASSGDADVRAAATRFLEAAEWPGRSDGPRRAQAPPLAPEERRRFDAGRAAYLSTCAPCHQPTGAGMPGVAAPLVGSKWVLGHPRQLVRILLQGKEGAMLMPPMGRSLSDEEIAAVLTYVRREWGHQASPVAPAFVQEIRGETTGRNRPWTEEELAAIYR